jgi:hypothetical protein
LPLTAIQYDSKVTNQFISIFTFVV